MPKEQKRQTSDFLLLRCFLCAFKNVICVFVLFVLLESFRKNKKKQKNYINTLIYITTDVYPLQPTWQVTLVFIYDHLWKSFPFMRISSYLWSSVGVFSFWLSVRIFSVYEKLFLFKTICKNLFFLWELFLNLFLFMIIRESIFLFMINFYYLFFITLTHLCVLILNCSKSILIL